MELTNSALVAQLQEKYTAFAAHIKSLDATTFEQHAEEKWSAGQQLEHLVLSVRPLRKIMAAPKFLFPLAWGKPNRSGRSYEELVAKYHEKLAAGGRASGRFVPREVSFAQRDKLTSQLLEEIRWLCDKTAKFSEEELDRFLLPHPLLGKITLREMLYFTIYHAEHHLESIRGQRHR
ncbi:MAG: DinB family protein [Chitinophagales bacterium]